jgi:hypothetical protein
MNKQNINSTNYESFYLDYLEGNLNETGTLDLFAFLNEHPEFQVDEELPVLEQRGDFLGDDFKNLLKADLASEIISLNNIDFFLLAEKENQLSDEKKQELAAFVATNPKYRTDQKLYALSTLKADTSIVYAEKRNLKQRAPIVLWPYYSALAAACVVFIFWVFANQNNDLDVVSAASELNYTVKKRPNTQLAEDGKNEQIETHDDFVQNPKQNIRARKQILKQEIQLKEPMQVANTEKLEKPAKIKLIDEEKLDNITLAFEPNPKTTKDPKEDRVITAMSTGYGMAMKDVAPPITRKLSEIIKTDVKLKKGKDIKEDREGLFIKLGTFEFYRNKKAKP